MKQKPLLEILQGKVIGLFSLCLLLCMNVLSVHSESYMLSVGESVTISQTPYGGGYIDNVGLNDYIDSHLEFIENADNSATIRVKSYFDYTATVKLVFIERYTYMGKTQQSTYYRNIDITCKFVTPTSVSLPKTINVSTSGQVDITPTIEPEGASVTSISWTKSNGSAVFSIVPTDNKCTITGKTAGEGSITVTVNGNEKLKATSTVIVYDPSNPPPTSVSLPKTKEISIGGHVTLKPTLSPSNASTTYIWTSSNESVATVSYGKVVGKAEGTTTITVWTANSLTATCMVTVVRSNGKDDEGAGNSNSGTVDGHGYVDLGLSVKWATCNVGASKPEDFGGYYAWGETVEGGSYSRATYTPSTSISTDIKGTRYDVAYVKWGTNWRMPTVSEYNELFSKCTCKEETLNGVSGYRLTGPNGASIFFPKAGYKEDGKTYNNLRLWTSTPRVTDDTRLKAWQAFYSNYSMQTNNNGNRYAGYSVRPVTTAEGTPNEVTDITVTPSYRTIDVGETFYVDYELTPSGVSTTVTWSSDNPNVATVSSSGLVKGIGKGSTYIKAETSNGISGYCYVTVNSPTPDPVSITVSPSSKTIEVGETFYASYTLSPSNAETTVTWYSDDTSIATVSSSGKVTGIKAGITYINAKTSNGKEDRCKVTVEDVGLKDGDYFSVKTAEGVWMDFQVISSSSKTCRVKGHNYSAISEYTKGSLTIPSTIKGYTITCIGDSAFKDCSSLTSVTIPNSVTAIGDDAFRGCRGLTSLTIPNSVTSIGDWAFGSCSSLTSLTIPNGVTTIGNRAFRNCSGLISLTIPNSVTSIGEKVFMRCSSLTSVMIPNSVTTIGDEAFWNCSSLASITIPNSVTSIGNYTFWKCSGLISLTIPNSVTTIGKYAFEGCSGLTSLTIPNSVTTIGNSAFSGCSGLTSLTIPNSVTTIGNSAFYGCSGLTSITIPNSVTTIGVSAFGGTDAISIFVSSGNKMYDSRNNCNAIIETSTNTLISGCKNTSIPNSVTTIGDGAFHGCSGLTSITIPNSVTAIGHDAFYDCSGLTSITIPSSVKSIGYRAFMYCQSLTSVTIPNSVETIEGQAFGSCI